MQTVSIENCLDPDFEVPGVYLLCADQMELYAGETENIRQRIEFVLGCAAWMELEPTKVGFIPESSKDRHGLQSAIAHRENPLLNCRLLQFEEELPDPVVDRQLTFAFE